MNDVASLEELLHHSAWMKRLANSLVRDGAGADDLVQDAWVAALEHPPQSGSTVRSWLGQVVRNRRRESLRSASRSEQRAVRASDGNGPAPSVEALVGTAETGRILAAQLLALAEPYRSTLVQVFYEGLTPSEIAAHHGVPAGTVRWRLKEGLERLRTQLDRTQGDRTSWLALLTPLVGTPAPRPAPAPVPPAVSILHGGLAMKIGLATLGVAAAAAAVLSTSGTTHADAPDARPAAAETPAKPAPVTHAVPAKRLAPQAIKSAHDQLLAQVVRALAAQPKPSLATTTSAPAPDLDKDYIQAQIRELVPTIQGCYETALQTHPMLAGKLVVSFTIVGDPSVGGLVGQSAISQADPGLADPDFQECVQESMYAARFPPPAAGGEVKVTYPFVFNSSPSAR